LIVFYVIVTHFILFFYIMMLGSKGILPPTDANGLFRCFAAPTILQTFRIRYFFMFGGSQGQKPYHASMNGF